MVKAILVPHTHWDREWYKPYAAFSARLHEMFDGLVAGMAREPRFRHFHLDGQSVMLDDELAVRPERAAVLGELFRSGQLSIGPWYTQADEFLCSGETIFRNLERGLERARSVGVEDPVGGPWAGYLPDQFGHIGQMPQILRTFGIEHAVVLRGVPAALDRSPFRWRAPDGSEVLAEYLVHGYFLAADLVDHLASAEDLAAELARVVDLAAATSDRDTVLLPMGGDHTGPATELFGLLDAAAAIAGHEVRVGSLAEYLEVASVPAGLPAWTGELRAASRIPLLPGVVATRPAQKRRRARLEARLERYAEPLIALAPGMGGHAAALDEAWRMLLLNAAHDSAYGCSHDQVARDVDDRFAAAEALVEAAIGAAAGRLAADARIPGVLRWNPSPFPREGLPGLGWDVVPAGWRDAPAVRPVAVRVDGTALVLDDGTTLRIADEDDIGDLYTFCPRPGTAPVAPIAVTPIGGGVVFVELPGVSLELRLTRRGDDPFVRIDGVIHNGRPDHRLRLWVDLDATPDGSTALAPFEVVDRPLVGEGYADEIGSPTWPASGAVLAGSTALLADGVVEYEVAGARLGITLLRAVGIIARTGLATRPVWAGPPVLTPEAQCLGEIAFALGIAREAGRAMLPELRERFALPILEVAAPGGGQADTGRLLEVEGAQLSSVRRVADGLAVRVWNDRAEARTCRIAGRPIDLGPARILTVTVDADAGAADTPAT